jgi:NAD(P)-dependent dehydrogenase (short-subunit alcohol dehydrogenase family)
MIGERKIALVTGANKGLGKGVVELLLEKGCKVVLTSRNQEKGLAAVHDIKRKYEDVFYCHLDIGDRSSIKSAAAYCKEKFGKLDILINNAGINYDQWHNALNADLDECRKTLEINLFGQWMMVQEFVPLLKNSISGRIVNVSSGAGSITREEPGTPGYSIAKAGLNMLTIKLGHVLKKDNILINAVCPGWVKTEMGGSQAPREIQEGAESIIWPAMINNDGPTGGFFRDGKSIAW